MYCIRLMAFPLLNRFVSSRKKNARVRNVKNLLKPPPHGRKKKHTQRLNKSTFQIFMECGNILEYIAIRNVEFWNINRHLDIRRHIYNTEILLVGGRSAEQCIGQHIKTKSDWLSFWEGSYCLCMLFALCRMFYDYFIVILVLFSLVGVFVLFINSKLELFGSMWHDPIVIAFIVLRIEVQFTFHVNGIIVQTHQTTNKEWRYESNAFTKAALA